MNLLAGNLQAFRRQAHRGTANFASFTNNETSTSGTFRIKKVAYSSPSHSHLREIVAWLWKKKQEIRSATVKRRFAISQQPNLPQDVPALKRTKLATRPSWAAFRGKDGPLGQGIQPFTGEREETQVHTQSRW